MEEKRDWTSMVTLRSDTGNLHQLVFDFALESIWGKFQFVYLNTYLHLDIIFSVISQWIPLHSVNA